MPKTVAKPRIVQVEGRKGEPTDRRVQDRRCPEIVPRPRSRAGGGSSTTSAGGPKRQLPSLTSFPPYARAEAVKMARAAAKAFCAQPAS